MRPVSPDRLYPSPLTLPVPTWTPQPDRQSKVGLVVAIPLELVQIMSVSLGRSLLSSSLSFTRGSDQRWYLDIRLCTVPARIAWATTGVENSKSNVLRTFQRSKN